MSSTFVPEDQATRSVSESCVGSDVDAVLARALSGTCISEGGAPALHRSRRVGSCRDHSVAVIGAPAPVEKYISPAHAKPVGETFACVASVRGVGVIGGVHCARVSRDCDVNTYG